MGVRRKMNCIIVHGSNSTEKDSRKGLPENERHWKTWLKEELEKKGIKVSNKLYAKDWSPIYNEWKEEFEKNQIDEDTVLVGHSAGGAFLVRWLSETKRKIKKLILVSPGKARKPSRDSLSNLYGNKIHKDIANYVCEGIIVYTAEDLINTIRNIDKIDPKFK